MKKIVAIVALLTFGFSNAQDVISSNKKISFGAKTGLNISMINREAQAGFHIGGITEIKFTDKISLQPELMYSYTKGIGKDRFNATWYTSGSSYGNNFSYKHEITLKKIIFPVMFKYYASPKFSLEVGPQLDYIISGKSRFATSNTKYTYIGGVKSSNATTPTNPGEDYFVFKKVTFGFNFGLGYQLASGVFFQSRYTLGLTDPVSNNTTKGESFKDSNIQFSVGYKF